MAQKFQIKRTVESGRSPNTTNASNGSYIAPGELAVNLADRKLFTANTASGLIELGSNLTNLSVTSTATINALAATTIEANGAIGTSGQILTANGSGIFWASPATLSVNTAQEYIWTNNHTFNSNVSLSSVIANSSLGSNGQVLTSNGSTVYWAEPTNANTSLKVYTYNIASNTTVISGADANSKVLYYQAGLESVYVNGSRQVVGVDYNITNSSAITFTSNAINGDVVQVVAVTPSVGSVLDGSNSATTSTTANTVIDSFSKDVYRTAKYLVQITSGSNYHASEVLLLHDGTDAYVTEYGIIYSNTSLGNISANINGGVVDLLVAPINASSTIKVKRIFVEV